MSLKLGTVGGHIVGGSHVGWAETAITFLFKAINADVLDLVLNEAALNSNLQNILIPIARVWAEHRDTAERTALPGLTSFRISADKRTPTGNFQLVFADAITLNERGTAYADILNSKNEYKIIVDAGYRVNGVDYYTQILTGIKQDVTENYGRSSHSITIVGRDLSDELTRIDGTLPAYTGSAKTLIIQLLNEAGIQGYDLRFTDFNFAAQVFNQDNGLQIIEIIADRFGVLNWYVEGDGTFVLTTPSSDINYDYSYDSDRNIFTLNYQDSNAGRFNKVIVTGQNIYLIREDIPDQADYGIRKSDLQSNLIQSQASAEAAADELILDSYKKEIRFEIPFNPYLTIDTVLRINHASAGIIDQLVRVSGFTHSFNASGKTKSFTSFIQAEKIENFGGTLSTTEVA